MAYQHRLAFVPQVLIYLLLGVFSVACLAPFLFIITGSVHRRAGDHRARVLPRAENDLGRGLGDDPPRLSPDRERLLRHGHRHPREVRLLSLLVTSLLAYPLSVSTLRYRNILAFFVFFTMIFSGGMVPWYIIVSRVLRLRNTIFALILPYTINAWNTFLLRNFFRTIPKEIPESAKIDGATELTIFSRLILPLSKPGLATVGPVHRPRILERLVARPDVHREPQPVPGAAAAARHHLQRGVPPLGLAASLASDASRALPFESVKMATCLVTIGPIIFLYPFVQRFFMKGIIVGAVKG